MRGAGTPWRLNPHYVPHYVDSTWWAARTLVARARDGRRPPVRDSQPAQIRAGEPLPPGPGRVPGPATPASAQHPRPTPAARPPEPLLDGMPSVTTPAA